MIPKINKILYTTDLSLNSAYAFRYAMESARRHDAQVHILHVVELTPKMITMALFAGADPDKIYESRQTVKEELRRKIEERLIQFAESELEGNQELLKCIAGIHVVEGDPAATILEKTDEFGCDMVVMGANGKGITSHTFLGGVAERVLRRIRKPAYIIPLLEKGA